jgi:putative radical SAM enzyme (TIGR03279 family)
VIHVTQVGSESIGEGIGLVPGTELLSVNGRDLEDFLDWEFLTADEEFTLVFRRPGDTDEHEVEVIRPIEEHLGVAVEPPRIRRCANRCDFCFVDGNPTGLREVLNIRDDDYRLSFRYGNFATLTNLKDHDTARIIEYRLSPLYVSVHASDPQIRRWVLRNPQAPDVMAQMRHFADHGIELHTQIVMAPGMNDGAVLTETLDALWGFGPKILTVSVVPVGLTEFSKHHLVGEPDRDQCRDAVERVERAIQRARAERGITWAFGADELYLRANVELPPAEIYDSFDQVENGVGSVRWLQRQVSEGAPHLPAWTGRRIGVLTGMSMGPLLPQVLDPLTEATGAEFRLMPIENDLFGPRVTTAGLLSGEAIRAAIAAMPALDLVLIPGECLNDDALFIDSLPFAELQACSDVPIRPSKTFIDALQEPLAA